MPNAGKRCRSGGVVLTGGGKSPGSVMDQRSVGLQLPGNLLLLNINLQNWMIHFSALLINVPIMIAKVLVLYNRINPVPIKPFFWYAKIFLPYIIIPGSSASNFNSFSGNFR
jgi:hypothetical protein